MPEIGKGSQGASPVARAGGGDISEIELSRERYTLQTTPPARVQRAHPKKQLFSAPVTKFTASSGAPGRHVALIRSCLEQYRRPAPQARARIVPKALSMEDLTPAKRIRKEKCEKASAQAVVPSQLGSGREQRAAATIGRFMLVQAWRRRRHEVRCLRKTLEGQVCSSERLRIQVHTLKYLLDSDNAKVRLAMKELERLKHLLKDKELEKQVLEREKEALEGDVCAAEDRASEMSIKWRNSRNELECVRASAARSEHALAVERAASVEARRQRDLACSRLSSLEEELSQHEKLLSATHGELDTLRRALATTQQELELAREQLAEERDARESCDSECAELGERLASTQAERGALLQRVATLRDCVARLEAAERGRWHHQLHRLARQAGSWLPGVLLWALAPARHGC